MMCFSVDEEHNKALKIERLQSRTPLFKLLTPIEKITTKAPAAAAVTTAAPVAKGKENPYAKSGVGKCRKCGELVHKFNECPKRK